MPNTPDKSIKAPTQHQKIINLCRDAEWHCGNEFRAMFIFSPHKRRAEIEEDTQYYFEDRKCEHGSKNVKDYKMKEKVKVDVKTQNLAFSF